jgi:hypothetical protein
LAVPSAPVQVPVTCRVLGFSTQAFYQWKRDPVSRRDWDDEHLTNVAVDLHAMGELFTPDARYEPDPLPNGLPPVISTREQIVAGMTRLWRHNRETVGVYQRHVTTNVLITQLGSAAAEVQSVLTVTGSYADGRLELRRAGNYVDRLRKEGGRWRIAHRTLHLMAPPSLP